MQATTRVDFHLHSAYSDGALAPRELAEQLAADGVAFAALTDHDTVDGLGEFQEALARRNIGCIPAVELTVQCQGAEAHLLGYGIDPHHPELRGALLALRQAQAPGVHRIADSLRQRGTSLDHEAGRPPASTVAPAGKLDLAEAVSLLHRAGGRAFLAHPLILQPDRDRLRVLLAELRGVGLDGVEALYGPFAPDEREELCALAREAGLLISAGSDAHERRAGGQPGLGVEMPTELWKQFRDAVCVGRTTAATAAPQPRPRLKRHHFIFHVVFPTVLAVGLFTTAIFAVFLPAFERSLLDRKREMIRELTNSAISILARYERDERLGLLSRAQAQENARSRIEFLRYGREGKDYFWLQDMRPRIIMHPYRKDLNGQDVSGFQDARGTRIFVKFAELVRRRGEGYIEYFWQWKDDPSRVVPKESYIKGFAPWGWIIGTGIYLEDVKQEIARVERSLLHTLVGISVFVALLLAYVLRQSLRLERERSEAEEGLRESTERYRALVEATTEGTLLVVDGRCRYANPTFLAMVGCAEPELQLLDLADLVPEASGNETAWARVRGLLQGEETVGGFDGVLRRRDGSLVECVFVISPLSSAARSGFILLAKDVSLQLGYADPDAATRAHRLETLRQVAEAAPVGLFRARLTPRGTVVEGNAAALRLLRPPPGPAASGPLALAALFPQAAAYEDFLAELRQSGAADRRLLLATDEPGTRTVLLRATLGRDASGKPRHIDGAVEDITAQERQAREHEALIDRLQTPLLFLHEPISQVGPRGLFCQLDTPVETAARLMAAGQTSAVLVQSDPQTTVGIVTDHDLRERVAAGEVDGQQPVHRLMSSPLVTIPEHAEIYEALLVMEERGIQHLAVVDDAGQVTGVVRRQELLQFHGYGAIVLTREIARATTPAEAISSCRRAPDLARALIGCGAYPDRVTRLVASVCDAATERFVNLAMAELGPAPVPFVFLALGSQGRQEQNLASDQDNAIIYAPPGGAAEDPEAAAYLGELGRRVCGWLNAAGYPFCRGEVMAQNPQWCQSLATWKQYFSGWIRQAEPQQLLEFSIVFDFRPVCGALELAHELRRHVHAAVRETPAFLPHFAQNSLLFKPPLRLFGKLLAGTATGDHARLLNLKDAMMPIVSFARLYALGHGLNDTHTLDRLEALVEQGVLPEGSREETAAAYSFLMRLRLRQQAAALAAGQTPDNLISHRKLGTLDDTVLNQVFAQIAAVQKRISQQFLGGG